MTSETNSKRSVGTKVRSEVVGFRIFIQAGLFFCSAQKFSGRFRSPKKPFYMAEKPFFCSIGWKLGIFGKVPRTSRNRQPPIRFFGISHA